MDRGKSDAPDGIVVVAASREGDYFIKLRGSWDLVNRKALDDAFAAVPEGSDVVIDVQEVSYCDSTILTEIIRLYKRLLASGRRIDVVLGDSAVRRLFQLMHLDKLLSARSDRAQRA